jgi:hypothetical protein
VSLSALGSRLLALSSWEPCARVGDEAIGDRAIEREHSPRYRFTAGVYFYELGPALLFGSFGFQGE